MASPTSVEGTITETLERLSGMDRFNRWMADSVTPYMGRRVLEVGSGIGNFSDLFASRIQSPEDCLVVTDISRDYVNRLRERFRGNRQVHAYEYFMEKPPSEVRQLRVDTVVAFNVLEHIEDDMRALRKTREVLQPGGRIILLVPALQMLYNQFDHHLGHYRRYSKKELLIKGADAGFETEKIQYFNMVGSFGWYFNGKILRRKILPKNQLKFYNRIVPLARFLEEILGHPFGQSLLWVGRKKERP